MPANLTQKYRRAEQAFRQAATPDDELSCLQDMLRELPKHKGTDKLQADLKQRISQAKKDCEAARISKRYGPTVRFPRQGAGRVMVLGAPNTGKSQFVKTTTRAEPAVADYPFTTREPAPAMMPYEDIFVQLIDTPPITADVLDASTVGLVRGANLCLLLADLGSDSGWDACRSVLEQFEQSKTRLGRETYLDRDDIGRSYTKSYLVWNKIDLDDAALRFELFSENILPDLQSFQISALQGQGIKNLKSAIFHALDVVRVYTKSPTEKTPDMTNPYTIGRGGTLGEVAALIHQDLAANLKSARVWGSTTHDGTTVTADYVVRDKDIVELHV